MRYLLALLLLGGLGLPAAPAQTPDDIARLIERVLELETMDLARQEVKFRPGLEPMLLPVDADEAGMTVLKDPTEVHGKGKVAAAGWYRVHFVAPEKIGKLARPSKGFPVGIESNLLGGWEIFTYVNGKRAGGNGSGAIGAPQWVKAANEPPTSWRSNAQLYANPGDKVTVVILATSSPFADSVEGYGLRHLRLRLAGGHTGQRQTFYSSLHGARDRLARAKPDELKALQEKLKEPLACLDTLTRAADTGEMDQMSKAMSAAAKDIYAALMR